MRFRLRRRLTQVAAAAVTFALAGACTSDARPAAGTNSSRDDRVPASALASTTSTTATSTTAANSGATDEGRTEAVTACRTWAGAGAEPDASAISTNAQQADAAGQARTAATLSSQWQRLADAMTEVSTLPLTGVTPDQEAASERDLAVIRSECQSLGVAIP